MSNMPSDERLRTRLEALADKVAGVHSSRHPELVELHQRCVALRNDLEPHMAKEERGLFPMIRDLSTAISPPNFHCGSVAHPISMLMSEHEQTGTLLQAMRKLTNGYRVPDDACASYRALCDGLAALEADTHLHIHKENNALFPLSSNLNNGGHPPFEAASTWQVVIGAVTRTLERVWPGAGSARICRCRRVPTSWWC